MEAISLTACAFGLGRHWRKAGWWYCPLLPGAGKDPSPLGPFSIPRLKDLFYRSSNLQYFKRLIQIPQLPEVSPSHTLGAAKSRVPF